MRLQANGSVSAYHSPPTHKREITIEDDLHKFILDYQHPEETDHEVMLVMMAQNPQAALTSLGEAIRTGKMEIAKNLLRKGQAA